MSNKETLAFEIGTEEIPAFDLKHATTQLATLVPEALDAVRLPHGDVRIYSSPRRLIAVVDEVALETDAMDEVFRGPSVKIAFDDEGNPTKAALGFARGKGVAPEDLERREEDGVEYIYATRHVDAQRAVDLLPEVLQGVIEAISWPKSCRWGRTREVFTRPVRWLVALLGDEVIPVEFAGLVAGRDTWGHRTLAPGAYEVASADELIDVVSSAAVVPSQQAREQIIREGVAAVEQATGYHASLPPTTLTEVINLAEYPTVMVGTFDEEFLKVPEEIIVDAMLMHQRYFPLYDEACKLTNTFIIVSNGNPDCEAIIVDGNERVVAARLYDAKFFYEEDLKQPLESYVEHLDEVVFQEKLGTTRAKTDRVVALVGYLMEQGGFGPEELTDAKRAAYLAKADLVTNAVIEFTSVQGVMGSYYALASGENERVAGAIADHYRPRFAGDELPVDEVGSMVAVADKIDTICGLFAVGQAPTGSSDPFALRRAALGILAMLETGLPVELGAAIDFSLSLYEQEGLDFNKQAVAAEVLNFFLTRARVLLRDEGAAVDAIDAVMAGGVTEPMVLARRVRALEHARAESPEVFDDLATAFARANNLREESAGEAIDESLLIPVEATLLAAVIKAQAAVEQAMTEDRYDEALQDLAALRAPIDQFFDEVMVKDKDDAIRANRMALLNRFVQAFAQVADFGKMSRN